jgi:hypothetical protein
MAMTFIGYVQRDDAAWSEADFAAARTAGAGGPPEFAAKVLAMPANLPATCKVLGAWGTIGSPTALSVMLVEAESFADLAVITNYYSGWLRIEWNPTASGGIERN